MNRLCFSGFAGLVWMLAGATHLAGQTPAPAPAPAPPPVTDPNPGPSYIEDGGLSVQGWYWLTASQPRVRAGRLALTTTPGNFDFPDEAKGTYGFTASFPAGKQNSLRFSYFRSRVGSGVATARTDLALFSVGYAAGDTLITQYKFQGAKVSWDFLSYTFRNNIRLKTLWEVQAALIETLVDAPALTTESESFLGEGKKWMLSPSFGLGLEQAVSPRFRWEAKASGFGLPKRGAIGDAEAAAVLRLGRAELLAGYRFYTIKTSPREEFYFRQRLNGPMVGMRWYFDRAK